MSPSHSNECRAASISSCRPVAWPLDRKSTRLNSSHSQISYAVFCLKKTSDELGRDLGMGADKVREILKISQEPVSLETPIGDEEDSHLGDFIEDSKAIAPADTASHR